MGFGNILEAMPAGLADGLDVNSEGRRQTWDGSEILGLSNWVDHGVINWDEKFEGETGWVRESRVLPWYVQLLLADYLPSQDKPFW